MKSIMIKIKNPSGLHARPAATLVNCSKSFNSDITITKNNREINLKSLLALLSLGVSSGEEVLLKATGEDEDKAIQEITKIIDTLQD